MSMELTTGCIYDMFYHNKRVEHSGDYHPIVQILAIKALGTTNPDPNTTERNKLVINDGKHFATTVAMSDAIGKNIREGRIVKNSIVKIEKAVCNNNSGKNFIIIHDVSVISTASSRIGTAKNVTEAAPPTTAVQQPAVSNTTNTTPVTNTSYSAGGMTGSSGAPGTVYPIANLNPYQNKWTIKARVMKKSDIRTWSNARGEGKLFSMDLMDESAEIRCTGFTDTVDKFYNIIEQGKVYYISRCTLKTANKQYTAIKNDYEMTMNNDTTIVPCTDNASVPQMKLDYTNIADLESVTNGGFVDVIGVATQINDVQNITTRSSGKQLSKREIKIVDKSGAAVALTLWGNDAENFDASSSASPIISVKAAKVSDFGGRSLSVSFNSTMQINPDNNIAYDLRGWYDNQGKDMSVRQMSNSQGGGGASMETPYKTFAEIKVSDIQDKPEYFSNKATVVFMKKDNCMYTACPSPDCNKKVTQESGSEYRCEKCNQTYPNFKYRLMLSVKLADHTAQEWITCFQDSGEKLIGMPTDQLGELKSNNEQEFDKVMNKLLFTTWNFKIRGRVERYMDESRLKCTAVSVEPIDYIADIKRSLAQIRVLEA